MKIIIINPEVRMSGEFGHLFNFPTLDDIVAAQLATGDHETKRSAKLAAIDLYAAFIANEDNYYFDVYDVNAEGLMEAFRKEGSTIDMPMAQAVADVLLNDAEALAAAEEIEYVADFDAYLVEMGFLEDMAAYLR